jgi:hypothetical protein
MASLQDPACTDTDTDGLLPNQPWLALHPHYGMLLGVADFSAEQAYHRGKQRLHNAWGHGWGVYWGLGVAADAGSGEIRVAPGLALDGRGRELHADQAQCLHVGRWFAAHRGDAGFSFSETGDTVVFDAHVRIRHHACLTQAVPALADSCGGGSDVAYARVYETAVIELLPGLAPPRTHRHHLLRVLHGLDAAATDAGGAVLAADQTALDLRAGIKAAAPADRVAAAAAAFQRLAVLDSLADAPAREADDPDAGLFPCAGPAALTLANLAGIELTKDGDGWRLAAATVDNEIRSVLLSTATLQALAGGTLAALA